jgi:hypothetical protein
LCLEVEFFLFVFVFVFFFLQILVLIDQINKYSQQLEVVLNVWGRRNGGGEMEGIIVITSSCVQKKEPF